MGSAEPTNHMSLLLAKDYDGRNPSGEWMSEKLNGIRGWWTGEVLLSKEGNPIFAPDWFTAELPKLPLDGELYLGRGALERTQSIVTKQTPVDEEWAAIRYRVFAAPNNPDGFESEMDLAHRVLNGNPFASVHEQHLCQSKAHFDEFFYGVCEAGGEGAVLRGAGSVYAGGRRSFLLKRKPFDSDSATVLGYIAGKGKFAGKVGALTVEWRGLVFKIGAGLSARQRENPPEIGTAIRFSFSGVTANGCPTCAALSP